MVSLFQVKTFLRKLKQTEKEINEQGEKMKNELKALQFKHMLYYDLQ